MDRTHLEKPKPNIPYGTRKGPNMKNTDWKTENKMGKCSE